MKFLPFPFFFGLFEKSPFEGVQRSVFLILFLIFFNSIAFAQDNKRVDAIISMYPETFGNTEQLSKFITRDFTSEEDKVIRIKKIERETNKIKFNVPLTVGAKTLLVYFDDKPALGYKIN